MTEFLQKQCNDCQKTFPRQTQICPHDGAPLSVTVASNPFSHMLTERFEIVSEIGRGGMGIIYKGFDHQENCPVAIKLLLAETTEGSMMRQRFTNEARAAAALSHNHIVKVQEYSVSKDGLPYIVMEYINGLPLSDLLDTGAVDRTAVLRYLIDVCDALSHAHRRSIIHRDLKPSNIMIADGGRAVLVDFGIAKIFTQPGQVSMHLTQTGEVFGSPLYMSPEQCMGQRLDHRSDVYSMGCVIYECLTGEPPFAGNSFMKVVMKHVNDDPQPFADNEQDMALESVVFKALAKYPDDRHDSMEELKKGLQYCLCLLENEDVSSFSEYESSYAAGAEEEQRLRLEAAASAGDTEAQLELAYFYSDPSHQLCNPDKAFQYAMAAATAENSLAEALLGDFFRDGLGTKADLNMAFYWYSKAALQGHPGAERLIGHMYLNGEAVSQDIEKGLFWLRLSCQHDDVDAQVTLADHLLEGAIVERNVEEAIKWYEAAAQLGSAEAQLELGFIYKNGNGVDADPALSHTWFAYAAEQKNPVALRQLAVDYAEGNGVNVDANQALKLMKESADGGDNEALVWLGFWHFEGFGKLAPDHKRAIRYYKEAAENGSEKAMRYLGYHYDRGYGVTTDARVAAHWYRQAVELNDADSKYYLALLYRDGRGVNQDTPRYMELLEEAAHEDVIDAVYELGLEELEQGKRKSARGWFLRAQELGHIDAADRLTELG